MMGRSGREQSRTRRSVGDVVRAHGAYCGVRATTEPDLFSALRDGNGNFASSCRSSTSSTGSTLGGMVVSGPDEGGLLSP